MRSPQSHLNARALFSCIQKLNVLTTRVHITRFNFFPPHFSPRLGVLVLPTSRLGPSRRDGRPVLTILQTQTQGEHTHTHFESERETLHPRARFLFSFFSSGHFRSNTKKREEKHCDIFGLCFVWYISSCLSKILCWCQVLNNVTSEATKPSPPLQCVCICVVCECVSILHGVIKKNVWCVRDFSIWISRDSLRKKKKRIWES